ncbi:putative actin-like protein [Trypanosoma conorhini]|uniref:Putative actin-like protein n=1 Tax=Trypanosoma conorhini TaxID=83891 RepID=A0A422PZX8_9TRYP|nr:putative actin-like protein [Trypanosoma conorhini]RNF23302.1 putative actin-like protein [Trypanosoma conorhini]
MLSAGTACYRDVMDRLSQRLALLLVEAEAYVQQRHLYGEAEALHAAAAAAEPQVSLQPCPLLSWPPLRVRQRVDALRAQLSERKELQETMRNVDASMRLLRQEFLLVDVGAAAASSHLRRDGYGADAELGRRTVADGSKHDSRGGGGVAAQEEAVRRIVWLHQQLRCHKEDFCELRKRASHTHERLHQQFERIADACGSIFRATAYNGDGNSEDMQGNNGDGNARTTAEAADPAELHSLCRRNGERARRLQSRLQRVLSLYRQVVARTNRELCRVELEVQAMERQSPHAEELALPHYGGGGGGG